MDSEFRNCDRLGERLIRGRGVAADKFPDAIDHHLRGVDTVQLKPPGIGTLSLAIEMRGVRILPANVIPVVYVLTQYDHMHPSDGLLIELFQELISGRTAGASLRSEQLHQDRDSRRRLGRWTRVTVAHQGRTNNNSKY